MQSMKSLVKVERNLFCVLFLLLMMALGGECVGGIIYVKVGGSGDGSSWGDALGDLDSALELSVAGDEIWVGAGSYSPQVMRLLSGLEEYGASFTLRDGVSLYGGFRGDEGALEARQVLPDGHGSWDFAHKTVLCQGDGVYGGVVRCGDIAFERGGVLDGFVIEGGNAIGSDLDGCGGGIQGAGLLTIRNCVIRGNFARDGGGAYLTGGVTITGCLVEGNELVEEGWGGCGGGLYLGGKGYVVQAIVACWNGVAQGGVQNGGGMYLVGEGQASHCTIVGNRSRREGSGVWCDTGSEVLNSIIWGNTPDLVQAFGDSVSFGGCAVEGGCSGYGIIPLLAENCGPGGIDVNDNWVGGYYVCFVDPETGDFRLGGGSYAIARGFAGIEGYDAAGMDLQSGGLVDIGAYATGLRGNLAADFSVGYPFVYGGDSGIRTHWGVLSPAGCQNMYFGDTGDVLLDGEESLSTWIGQWKRSGIVDIGLQAWVDNDDWNVFELVKSVDVRPRVLVVSADDAEHRYGEPFPELTWTLVSGRLIGDDKLVGSLSCEEGEELNRAYAIGRGDLNVDDGRGGVNYRIEFLPGELMRLKGIAGLAVEEREKEYDGKGFQVDVDTEPDGVNLDVTYAGIDGTEYGPSNEPPKDAGSYQVDIVADDPHYEGGLTIIITITKAPLDILADNKTKSYGAENPPLTMTFVGFKGDDDQASIQLPDISTVATADSPVVEGGYPIVLAGGSAKNYELTLTDGVLTIERAALSIADVSASDLTYGQTLSESVLTGIVKNSATGSLVPGRFVWEAGGEYPYAGTSDHGWLFVPEDQANHLPGEGEIPVLVRPRPIAVTANGAGKAYGDSDPELAFTISSGSLVGTDAFSGSLARDPGENVGTYGIVQGSLTLSSNYTLSYVPGEFTIRARPLTIVADNVQREYGEAESGLTWSIGSGDLAFDDKVAGSLVREVGERPGTYKILQGDLSAGANYALTFTSGTYTILAGSLRLVGDASGTPLVYGQVLSESDLIGQVVHGKTGEAVAGRMDWVDGAEGLPVGNWSRPWNFVAEEADCYQPLGGNANVEVSPAQLSVELVNNVPKREYGYANPEFELDITGFVHGEDESVLIKVPVASCGADLTSRPGEYAITLGGGQAANYEFTYGSGTLTVEGAKLEISQEVATNEIVYGDPLSEAALAGEFRHPGLDIVIDGELAWVEAGDTLLPAGTHGQEWIFTPDEPQYEVVRGILDVIVKKASLRVVVKDVRRMVGQDNPEWEYEYEGFVNGDTSEFEGVFAEHPVAECEAGSDAVVGEYPIELSGGNSANYELELVDGVLTVVPAVPNMGPVEPIELIYGTTLNEYGDPRVDLRHPLTGDMVPGTFTWNGGDAILEVGEYEIGFDFMPDDVDYLGGIAGVALVRVVPRAITVGLYESALSRRYIDRETNWMTRYKVYVGSLVQGDAPTGAFSREPGDDVGSYKVLQGTIDFGPNYDVTYLEQYYVIHPFAIPVTPKACGKGYGEADPAIEYKLASARHADWLHGELSREPGEELGSYPITLGTMSTVSANYTIDLRPGTFVIGPCELIVQLRSYTISYGDDMPEFGWDVKSGALVNGDQLKGKPACEYTDAFGQYPITQGTLSVDPNYNLTVLPGKLTLTKRAITVYCDDIKILAGEPNYDIPYYLADGQSLAQGDSFVGALSPFIAGTTNFAAYVQRGDLSVTNADKYAITFNLGRLTVVPRKLILSELPVPEPVMYGDELQESALVGGLCLHPITMEPVEGTWSWSEPAHVVLDMNKVRYACVFVPADGNFPNLTSEVDVVRLRRKITVRAKSHHIIYGDPMPALTYEVIEGRVVLEGDLVGSLSAIERDPVSKEYPKVFDVSCLGLAVRRSCYDCEFIDGTIVVSKRQVVIAANNVMKRVGEADPALTFSIQSGNLVDDSWNGSLTRDAGEEPGVYTIRLGTLEVKKAPGAHEVIFLEGTLTILDEGEEAEMSASTRVVVDDDWDGIYAENEEFTHNGTDYKFGYNAFATLEAALEAVAPGGCVQVMSGQYVAPTGEWIVRKGVAILGNATYDDDQVELLGTIRTSGSEVNSLLLSNVCVDVEGESDGALIIGDGTGNVTCLNCVIGADGTAVQIGVHGGGVTIQGSSVMSEATTIRCVRSPQQAPPTNFVYLIANGFYGENLLENQGFPVVLDRNQFNGTWYE
jgi:hypothetical protein